MLPNSFSAMEPEVAPQNVGCTALRLFTWMLTLKSLLPLSIRRNFVIQIRQIFAKREWDKYSSYCSGKSVQWDCCYEMTRTHHREVPQNSWQRARLPIFLAHAQNVTVSLQWYFFTRLILKELPCIGAMQV